MPSFANAYSDADRWNLAFYVLTLARPPQIAERYLYPELNKRFDLNQQAVLSDLDLSAILESGGAVGSLGRSQLDYLRAIVPFTDRQLPRSPPN